MIAICGCLGEGYEAVHQHHIAAPLSVAHGHFDPADLACGARERITACALESGAVCCVVAARKEAIGGVVGLVAETVAEVVQHRLKLAFPLRCRQIESGPERGRSSAPWLR